MVSVETLDDVTFETKATMRPTMLAFFRLGTLTVERGESKWQVQHLV